MLAAKRRAAQLRRHAGPGGRQTAKQILVVLAIIVLLLVAVFSAAFFSRSLVSSRGSDDVMNASTPTLAAIRNRLGLPRLGRFTFHMREMLAGVRSRARKGLGGGATSSLPAPPALLPGERVPLLLENVSLSGHPPLLSRADHSPAGPDFDTKGAPVSTSFFIADPPLTTGEDNLFRYVVRAEDAVKDVVLALLTSRGRARGSGRDKSDAPPASTEGIAASPPPPHELSCKASPVTWRYWCVAALRQAFPGLWMPGGGAGPAEDAVPVPLPHGAPFSSTRLWSLDVGSTGAGYYGLLSASLGVPAVLVDPQPQCSLWAGEAARASGLSDAVAAVLAVPMRGKGTQRVPVRTGCLGTSTIESPPADAEARRAQLYAQQLGAAAAELQDVPFLSADEVVAAQEARSGLPPGSAVFLFAKVDGAGWEDRVVLDGMQGLLASRRILTLVVELNKQHLVRRLRSGEGKGTLLAEMPPGADAVASGGTAGYVPPASRHQSTITEGENAALTAHIVAFVRGVMGHGFQMLTADRGWWSAQDPFDSFSRDDGALEAWAAKVMMRGEVDLFFYLPDSAVPGSLQ